MYVSRNLCHPRGLKNDHMTDNETTKTEENRHQTIIRRSVGIRHHASSARETHHTHTWKTSRGSVGYVSSKLSYLCNEIGERESTTYIIVIKRFRHTKNQTNDSRKKKTVPKKHVVLSPRNWPFFLPCTSSH